jgi:hypothetical protein
MNTTLDDYKRFIRLSCWSAAFELGKALKDVRSGFCAPEEVTAARKKAKEIYQIAKLSALAWMVLPILQEGVRKYRR